MDDAPFHRELERQGIPFRIVVWDDPTVDWSAFLACLVRTTWDYTLRHEEYLAWVDEVSKKTLLLNDAETIRWNAHKGYLRDLERAGIPITPTDWLASGGAVADMAAILRERGYAKAFLKPAIGASARNTLRFAVTPEGIKAAQEHVTRLLPTVDFMLQPYLASVETTGELSAIFFDGELSHAVRKIPVPGDYRVQDDHGASDEPYELSAKERDFAEAVLRAAGRDFLYARVDYLIDETGSPLLNELEVIEPSLFFRHGPKAAEMLTGALKRRL